MTGSRDWWDRDRLDGILSQFLEGDITLVSGACPTGADLMAEEYAREHGWIVELHPANWLRYGKRAGFIRNSEMVALGADVCLAFILNGSKGATKCSDLAEQAGIEVQRFTDGEVIVP